MLITDLDGTLLPSGGVPSPEAVAVLKKLGAEKVLRVVATGRSLYGVRRVLSADFPIDFVIFSCGAGAMRWSTGEILFRRELEGPIVEQVAQTLLEEKVDFSIHDPIPDNHRYRFVQRGTPNPDFERRLSKHQAISRAWDRSEPLGKVSQFLVVDPVAKSGALHARIEKLLPESSVIRSTSPLDHQSAWIEIYAAGVSKGAAADWLARHQGIRRERIMAIGNDYNDLDLLEWAGFPYVVGNAPDSLLARFRPVAFADAGGFPEAVAHWEAERRYFY